MTVKLKCVVRHVKKDWEPILVGAAWIVAALAVTVVAGLIGWVLRVQLVAGSLFVWHILSIVVSIVVSLWYLAVDGLVVYYLTLFIALYKTKKDLLAPERDYMGEAKTPEELKDESAWETVSTGAIVIGFTAGIEMIVIMFFGGSNNLVVCATIVSIVILVIATPVCYAIARCKDEVEP